MAKSIYLESTYGELHQVPCGMEEQVCSIIASMLMNHPDGVNVSDESLVLGGLVLKTPGVYTNLQLLHALGFTDFIRRVEYCGALFKLNKKALDYLASCP